MTQPPVFGDLLLKNTLALPNGAATEDGAALEVGQTNRGAFPGEVEVKITAPALVDADLGSSDTMKYSLITEDIAGDEAFYDPDVLLADVITQTGTGSGAAAATWQGRLPSSGVLRSIGLRAVNSAGGDASDKSATLELKF